MAFAPPQCFHAASAVESALVWFSGLPRGHVMIKAWLQYNTTAAATPSQRQQLAQQSRTMAMARIPGPQVLPWNMDERTSVDVVTVYVASPSHLPEWTEAGCGILLTPLS